MIINRKTSFFEGDENNNFDVNTAPMTFRPVVKDAGTTIVRVKDVEKFPGAPREEWRSAVQSQTQSVNMMCIQRWEKIKVGEHHHTKSFQERVSSLSYVKAQRMFEIAGCGNSHEDTGRAVFTANVNAITGRMVMLTAGMYGWYMTRIDLNSDFLHASLDSAEEVYVRPPPILERCGFTERGALWKPKKAFCGFRSAPILWGLLRDAVLAALVMCFEGREYALRQSCADRALWIIVWLGGENGFARS